MKKFLLLTILFSLSAGLLAQENDSNETAPNDTVTIKMLVKYLKPFNRINIESGLLNVNLYQSDTNKIEIIGGASVANNISFEVDGNELEIDGGDLKDKADINVYFVDLTGLDCSHIGRVESKTPIKNGDFTIEASGTTKINLELYVRTLGTEVSGAAGIVLKGEAEVHEFEVSGAAKLNAKNFATKITRVDVSGAGDVIIQASEEITGEISGAAKLLFYGEPDVHNLDVSGVAVLKGKAISDVEKDTVSIKIGNYDLRITEDDEDTGSDGGHHKHKHKIKSKSGSKYEMWSGLELGVGGYLNPSNKLDLPANYDFMELNYSKSITVGLNLFEKDIPIIKNYFDLATGLGFEINNYKFRNDTRLVDNPNMLTGYVDTVVQLKKSKLRVSYLTVPLFFEINTGSRPSNALHLGAGVLFGYNIGSKTKTVRSDNDNTEKAKGDYHINPFKYSLMARVGFGDNMVLYANYSLVQLFEPNKGPEMYPFSVGIALIDF